MNPIVGLVINQQRLGQPPCWSSAISHLSWDVGPETVQTSHPVTGLMICGIIPQTARPFQVGELFYHSTPVIQIDSQKLRSKDHSNCSAGVESKGHDNRRDPTEGTWTPWTPRRKWSGGFFRSFHILVCRRKHTLGIDGIDVEGCPNSIYVYLSYYSSMLFLVAVETVVPCHSCCQLDT